MICPHCGQETPDVGDVCEHCGGALLPEVRPPRLLSQIQGLILPEPVISVGRLHHPDVTLPPA
jgi:predicted amidophosphoribosyltransferase